MTGARIVVLYNHDFEAGDAPDATSVEDAARAITDALVAAGHRAERRGVRGTDVLGVLAALGADPPDLLFNLCESLGGKPENEPTFAGLCALFGIPYTGADLLSLASCLHKQRTKALLAAGGVPTPPYRYLADARALADPALDGLDYPWFVKLAHEDASLGITEANVVRDAAALRARAGELMRDHAQGVLAERYVEGREVNVTLLGDAADARVLPLHEIDFGHMPDDRPRIVSYAAKWDEHHVDYAGTKPVPLRGMAAGVMVEIERVARAAYAALDLRDYGRVDLRVDAAGAPWVIDVNPNPDLSPDAGVARAARAAGIEYPALIAQIADRALARSRKTS